MKLKLANEKNEMVTKSASYHRTLMAGKENGFSSD